MLNSDIDYEKEYYELMKLVQESHKSLGLGKLDEVDHRNFPMFENLMVASKTLRKGLNRHQEIIDKIKEELVNLIEDFIDNPTSR